METLKIAAGELARILPNPGAGPPAGAGSLGAGGPAQMPFQELLKQAVSGANEMAQKSDAMTKALVEGKPVDLHRVMLAQQEAQIGFEIVLQMRDKLISAYQEISRMPM